MRWIKENKGGAMITVIAVILGVLLGILMSADFKQVREAEAVIGGAGNVTSNNNPHNFSFGSTGVNATDSTMQQVCIFCHTPHQAKVGDTSLLNAPLWNHKLSEVVSYQVKSPPGSFQNTIGSNIYNVNLISTPLSSPDGASKLCLSCHDGTIAVGAVYSRSDISLQGSCLGAIGNISSSCSAHIGTDLRKKHVVSVPMNDLLISASSFNCSQGTPYPQTFKLRYPWDASAPNANVILRPTTATYSGQPGVTRTASDSPQNKYKTGYNYGVQCSSCHDPHFWVNTKDTNVAGAMFIVDKINNMCKACHTPCP